MIIEENFRGVTKILQYNFSTKLSRPRLPVIGKLGMPVIPNEVISYDLFSNLVRLIKFNLFHNYTVLIRILYSIYIIKYMKSIYNTLLYIIV